MTLLILYVSPILVKGQAIEWNPDRPLTWNDFSGKPDYRSTHGAVSYWNITYTYQCENRDCTYIVIFNLKNLFDTQGSWVKRDAESDYLLSHEQLHFDICELFTRKLAAAFHATLFTSNFKAEIEEIYNKIRGECDAMQSKYDDESQHSKNTNMQYRWELYVYEQLKELPRNY